MIDYLAPIPESNRDRNFTVDAITFRPEASPFAKARESNRIIIEMQYAKQGIPEAVQACYLRQEVYRRLLQAAEKLPAGYRFKVFDGWRPLSVQKFLFEAYRERITKQYRNLPRNEVEKIVDTFVFPPSEDVNFPPPHTTGGAIDLTIVDEKNRELDMGSTFDEFGDSAHTRFFERKNSAAVADHRRMLYNVMISEGFTNLPTEWWHYDYGTNFWAFYSDCPAKYTGAFSEREVLRELNE